MYNTHVLHVSLLVSRKPSFVPLPNEMSVLCHRITASWPFWCLCMFVLYTCTWCMWVRNGILYIHVYSSVTIPMAFWGAERDLLHGWCARQVMHLSGVACLAPTINIYTFVKLVWQVFVCWWRCGWITLRWAWQAPYCRPYGDLSSYTYMCMYTCVHHHCIYEHMWNELIQYSLCCSSGHIQCTCTCKYMYKSALTLAPQRWTLNSHWGEHEWTHWRF